MTAIEAHIPKDIAPVKEPPAALHLGAEISNKSNAEFNHAKAETTGSAEASLNQATVSPTAIHFGKKTGHEAPVAAAKAQPAAAGGTDVLPDANHPVLPAMELMHMGMTQGEFDRVPPALVPIAEKLGKVGMAGLTDAEKTQEAKLSKYFDQNPESILLNDYTSTKVYAPTRLTPHEVDAEFNANSQKADLFGDRNYAKHIPF